jgi:hypothetical protein
LQAVAAFADATEERGVFLPDAANGAQAPGHSSSSAAAALGLQHRQTSLASPQSSPRIHPPHSADGDHAPRRVILSPRGAVVAASIASDAAGEARDSCSTDAGALNPLSAQQQQHEQQHEQQQQQQQHEQQQQLPRHRPVVIAASDDVDVASEARVRALRQP